jgi:hypothetical protein
MVLYFYQYHTFKIFRVYAFGYGLGIFKPTRGPTSTRITDSLRLRSISTADWNVLESPIKEKCQTINS